MSQEELILVVDDERDMLQNYQRMIKPLGYECLTAGNGRKALELIRKKLPGLILTDLRMPGMDGMDILRSTKEINSDIVVILITAYATIDTAVEAIKEGAFDYLPKPFTSEQLRGVIQKGLSHRQLLREPSLHSPSPEIIGQGPAMSELFRFVEKVARSEANILLTGDTGTGKELFARRIHERSCRAQKAFVPIDCSSLPENLLEGELFGYEKGAFTGAHVGRPGLLELAQGGTLFFDEIAELKPSLQAKLLRVIQERVFRRIGGRKWILLNVRILSATNRNLTQEISLGRFREDLFYRLNVIQVSLPALQERPEDIPSLAYHFLSRFDVGSRTVVGISRAAMRLLCRYPWPGNVRELQNVIERAVSVCEGKLVQPQDLPESVRLGVTALPLPTSPQVKAEFPFKEAKERWIADFEREYLKELLLRHQGNVSQAARKAEIDRKTIHRLAKKYELRGE